MELLRKELEEKIKEQQQQYETEIKSLKEQLESKRRKLGGFTDLEVALGTLRSNFSLQLVTISDVLKSIYLEDRKDPFKRRAFQLSQLGIFWSEIVSLGLELEQEEAPITVADMDHWNRMETSSKALIVQWLKDFRKSSFVKPETLISGNLWGFIIRKIMLSIEENCNSSHSRESVLQCFGEYNIGNLTAMGTKFYTDFVFTAGCHGLPLLLVELQASHKLFRAKKPRIHKDLKKLAVQMSAVLFEVIGMVRVRPENSINLSSLRAFGMLIFDSHVEYYVSRPVFEENGTFTILFEQILKEVDHDLYANENYAENVDYPDPDPDPNDPNSDIEPSENLDIGIIGDPDDDIMPPGDVNLETVAVLTNFLGKVHDYYSGLDESIIELYRNPHSHNKDPLLIYPDIIHKQFHTSGGTTPGVQQTQFHEYQSNSGSNVPTTSYVFSTLPLILHVDNPFVDVKKQEVKYLEGVTLAEMEYLNDLHDEDLGLQRAHCRSGLILGIVMGIFMAAKSGFVFEKFNIDDVTFRNGLFCIKSYDHAVPVSENMTLLDSLALFSKFYDEVYFMDQIMSEGDPEYTLLNSMEAIVFRRLHKFQKGPEPTDLDFLNMFKKAGQKYEEILDEKKEFYHNDATWFLLQSFIKSLQSLQSPQPSAN